jgi:hypothetical protein
MNSNAEKYLKYKMKYLLLQKDSSIKVDESSKSILSQEGGTNLLYPSTSDEIIKVYNNKDNSILDNVECDKYAPSIICTY